MEIRCCVAGDLQGGLGRLSTALAGEMTDVHVAGDILRAYDGGVDRFVIKEELMPNPRGLALFISSRRAE